MKTVLVNSIVFSLSLFFFCCDFKDIKSVSTTGELSISVDENIEPLMKDEIQEFERLNSEAKVKMKSEPTNNVIADLINGETKLIAVTRQLKKEEQELADKNRMELKSYPVAVDGIGFIVNPKNPVMRLTSDDLKKIFSGKISKWTEIVSQDEEQNVSVKKFFNGSNNTIKVFIQRKNSSTNGFVKDSILREEDYSQSAAVCSTSVQLLSNIRENESSIGIINMNWLSSGHQDTIDSTVRPLRVSKIWESGRQDDFVEFHQGFIYNGSYQYRRTIYVISSEVDMKLASGFITFLVKTDGQKVVLKNSLAPVTQPVRTIQIN